MRIESGMRAREVIALIALVFLSLSPGRTSSDPHHLLEDADRLALLYNWPKAARLYTEAERRFTQVGDNESALHAKFGRIRRKLKGEALPLVSEQLSRDLESSLVKRYPRLELEYLTKKAS